MVQARKWIALFLALIMVVGMFPATAISVSAEENGAQTPETQLLQTEATTEPTQGDIMPTETKEELAEASIDAASGTCGANLNWTLDENGLLTISGKGPMYNYGVGDAPWSSRHNITSVIISQGVTSISDSAFYNCKNLQSIEIAQTVTEIGAGAFSWCRSLTSIEIPEGVTQIKSNTFYECTSLADINLPDSLTKIEDEAFKNCCVLTNVTLPEGLTRISHEAFADCTGLERITIPSTVTYLGVQVFRNCPGLKEILVSEGNTVYYSKNGVLFFRNNLYRYPPACTETAYSIPDGITIIDNYAFEHASVLTSLTVPATVNTFMTSAFAGCTSLMELYYAGTQKQWDSISILDGNDVLDDVALYCQGNPVIDSGICGDNLTWTLDENGLLTISGTGAMTSAPWREREDFRYEITSLSIAEGVTEICHMAFYSLYDLTEAVIPASVTEIGGTAFANSGVTRVEILGATGIQSYAFNSCSNLETLVLNKDIPWIGQQAFENISLTEIYFSGTEEAWDTFLRINAREGMGNDALRNATNVVCNWGSIQEDIIETGACGQTAAWSLSSTGTLTIHGTGAVTSAPWLDAYQNQITSVIVTDGITDLCEGAFLNCAELKKIVVPASLISIGASVLYGCTGITSAGPIGSGSDYEFGWTAEIPANAFQYLNKLTKITWPKGITTIGNDSFRDCGFNKLVIPEGVTSIGSNAFMSCTSLKRLSLPATLTGTGSFVFANCTALEDVFVMCGEVSFGNNTFLYCDNIVNVFYSCPEKYIGFHFGIEHLQNAPHIYYGLNQDDESNFLIKQFDTWYINSNPSGTLCSTSSVAVDLCIAAGFSKKYDGISSYALEQNGRIVLHSISGAFSDILIGDYFVADVPVYAVFLDAENNEISREKLNIQIVDHYTITYVYQHFNGKPVKSVQINYSDGSQIQEPETPTLLGYAFSGWYASSACTGTAFFGNGNSEIRRQTTGDFQLYAKWVKHTSGSLLLCFDTWQFTNSKPYFDYHDDSVFYHEMSDQDYNILIKDLVNNRDKAQIDGEKEKPWNGVCWGLSAMVVLNQARYITMEDFPVKSNGNFYDSIGEIPDALDPNIKSMIHFYYLQQFRDELEKIWRKFDGPQKGDSKNLKKIINKMQQAKEPVLLNIRLINTAGQYICGHSVVAYDLEENNTTYNFKVYDCSMSSDRYYPVTVSKNTYLAVCSEWEDDWIREVKRQRKGEMEYILFATAVTAEELVKCPQLNRHNSLFRMAAEASSDSYRFQSESKHFTITDGNHFAEIQNGEVVSGDLPVVCCGAINEITEATDYLYEIPSLTNDNAYTVCYNDVASVRTSIKNNDEENGFYLRIDTTGAGGFTIMYDGSIHSQFTEDTEQKICVSRDDMETPWYSVEISGKSRGFCVVPSSQTVSLLSETETVISIETKAGNNNVILANVPISTEEILVKENNNKECVATKNQEVIAGSNFGYSVLFNTQLGSFVPTLTNVPVNSLIPAPTAPTTTGYLFEGWFKDESYTEKWDFATDIVTEDLVLYAGWSVDPNYMKSVTFRVPGTDDQVVYMPVESLIPVDYAPVGEDGQAMRWFLDQDCTEEWDFETDILKSHIILYGRIDVEQISVEQEYIVLNVGESAQLRAVVEPVSLADHVRWSMENGDTSVATVDRHGNVTAVGAGNTYVIASVMVGDTTYTTRCRIDVTAAIEIKDIQLSTTKLTTELFKTDYAAFEILLDLPQNQPEASTYSLRSRNTGVAMVDAAFTDETVDALFDLLVLDDRRVLVVPTDKAIQDAQTNSKSVKGSYSSTVAVIIAGLEEPVETTEKMTLTVKQTKPRLTGKIASFNSFYTGQSQEITISGGTATKISLNVDKKNPDWLNLEGNCLILNENAPAKNANVYLNVWTEEWAIPAAVTLSVKNIVKKPSLKLPSSTVIMLKDPSLSSGIELTLKCGSKNDTLEKLNVYNITAPYGYEISDFNQKTGTFRLTPAEGFKAGKINLTVSFSDTESVVILPLTVKTSAVTLKRDKSSITLNRALEDKAVISITATPADYTLNLTEDNLRLTDSKGKTLADDSILDVSVKNNKITVATNGNTPAGTYRIYVSADGSKEVYTTITVVNKTPAVSFKAKGNLDLSFPENSVTLAHSFKNYTGGTYEVVNWTVTEKKGNKVVNADVADLFVLDEENLILSWKEDCYDNLTSGNTYEVTLKLNLPGVVDPVSGKVSLTMKRTSIKLKLEKTSLSLNKLLGDTADVSVSCVTSGYNFTAPMMELWDSRGKTRLDSDEELSANGKLLVTWEDGKIHIELGEDAKFGESFQIRLKANAYSSAYTIKVTIPSESKSKVTVGLSAKGSIDVIRSSTPIVLTPAYKNCMAGKDWDETLWVYTSESKYKTAIPAEELFDITEENGSYIFTAKEGLNPKLKYKVQLVSTLGELEYKSSPVSISVKMGSAKLTMLSSDTTLFAKDKNDRAEMIFTAKDETLNQVKSIAIKDSKYKNLFEIIPYGNGEFAIGFANGVVDSSIRGKTITLNLNVFVEGNDTTTANATMKLKLTVVK